MGAKNNQRGEVVNDPIGRRDNQGNGMRAKEKNAARTWSNATAILDTSAPTWV